SVSTISKRIIVSSSATTMRTGWVDSVAVIRTSYYRCDGQGSVDHSTLATQSSSFGYSTKLCKIGQVPSPNGGIGRRVALKMQYRKMCGFESHFGYKSSASAIDTRCRLRGFYFP